MEMLNPLNLVIGALVLFAGGFALRGWIDQRKSTAKARAYAAATEIINQIRKLSSNEDAVAQAQAMATDEAAALKKLQDAVANLK